LHDLAWTIERLPEKFRRRVKARGQIRLRKIDGWQKIGAVLNQQSPGRGMVIIRAAFAATVALGLLGAPLAADAQQAGKVYRIGYLSVSQVDFDKSWVGAFRDGLRKLGYVEGQNLVIDQRHAAGHSERLPELAAELLRLKIDILVVYGAWLQPKRLPSMIPIVFTVAPDPVREGLVASLARPGGNITGLSDVHADLVPKRLELLKEVVPSASLVGLLRSGQFRGPAPVVGGPGHRPVTGLDGPSGGGQRT